MAIVRQVPQVYLRGSLANITMANLTKEEQTHISALTDYVANHPIMEKHKRSVMYQYNATIGADYRNDRANAEEEYHIAIWRAVVDLFYHRKYTFRCRVCNSTHYKTKRGKPKTIDRVEKYCPNCGQAEVTDAGDTSLVVGSLVTKSQFQDAYKHLNDRQRQPQCRSTVEPIPGDRKYADPQKVVDDPRQLKKFFGEFVWNYFRQQIAENKRKEHRKIVKPIIGRADTIIVEEFLYLCSRLDVDYNYCDRTEPQNGYYNIHLFGLLMPPEFSAEFSLIRQRAAESGVAVEADISAIRVKVTPGAPDLTAYVAKPEHVNMLENNGSVDEEGDGFTISQVSYRTVGGERMDLDDHVAVVDSTDAISAVRAALPDGHCRAVLDIRSGLGDVYRDFSERYGDGTPRVNHIAEYLGITPRAVNEHSKTIKIMCLANGLAPA